MPELQEGVPPTTKTRDKKLVMQPFEAQEQPAPRTFKQIWLTGPGVLFAHASDNTLWHLRNDFTWQRVADLPQDPPTVVE